MHSIAALKIYGKLLLGRKFLGTTEVPSLSEVSNVKRKCCEILEVPSL